MFSNSNGILKRKRVGFLLSRRKMRKSIFDTFAHLCGYVTFYLELVLMPQMWISVISPFLECVELFPASNIFLFIT